MLITRLIDTFLRHRIVSLSFFLRTINKHFQSISTNANFDKFGKYRIKIYSSSLPRKVQILWRINVRFSCKDPSSMVDATKLN